LVEIYPATIFSNSLQYQWFSCSTPKEEDFQPVANAIQSSHSPGPISATTYYRRRTTNVSSGQSIFSNIIKLTVVSADWEDRNYIREYNVQVTYTYNIHGQITGINKDYALKNPSNYNKWGHFFGMYLGYDNRDNVFSQSRLSGLLTGVLWNTQGDDAQRKYDYTYDNANRLTNADFTEQKHPGDGWSNGKMDFSVNGNGGKITYDANGNLTSLLRKGVIPGTAAPVVIDDLAYTYETHSNKLQTVTDNTTLSSSLNGKQGDFKDGTNGTADYVCDHNGNLVIDLNKNIKELENVAGADGISYNYLGKPEKIRIAGKGTVRMVYNANGNKLQRAFIPENGDPATVTTYISEFVYQQTGSLTTNTVAPFMQTGGSLSYISFEEGLIRVIEPITVNNNNLDGLQIGGNITLINGKEGVFDYFIRDYQSSVQMILTEEVHAALNTCTMESGRSTAEEPVFGQTGGANEVVSTRYPAGPTNWQNSNIGSSVSQLGNIAGHNIGPNTLQKVMAGDKVSAYVDYYYQAATGGDNTNIVANVLTSLGQAIIGGGAATDLVKSNVAPINNQLNGANGFLQAVHPSSDGTNTPRAYLTALFFDERFNFIEAADGGVMQQQVAASITDAGSQLSWGNFKAPKNGYVYVYVSNHSDQDVYFDNMKVGITRGNIIEENHYYAYGLKIAAISSQKPGHVNEGVLNNNFKYQGSFGEMDDDLGWNDFEYRSYDVQIGRWLQIDPLDKFTSPYSGMDNDPVNNIDPDGADPLPVPFIWKIPDAIAKGASTGASVASTISKVTITGGKTAAGIVRVAKVVNNTVSVAARVSQTTARLTTPGVTIPPYLQNAGPGPVKLDPKFAFQKGINGDNLTQTSIITLNYIMSQVKVKKLTISSTGRGPVKQVDLMFHQQESKKPIKYKAPGDAVMNVYRKMKGTKATDAEIKKAMLAECYKQGPGNVSGHCADPADQNAIDFGNNSLAADLTLEEKERFRTILQGMRDKGWLSNFLTPENTGGTEPAFHIQIKNKDRLIGTGTPGQYHTIAPWSNFGTQRPNWVSWP
jgi:RHS repeat-associated protein